MMIFYIRYLVFLCLFLSALTRDVFGQQGNNATEALLFESTFEQDVHSNLWSAEICRQDAITLTKMVSRKGNYSARFEFAKTDPLKNNGYARAELKQNFRSDASGENWYGFSNFFPSDFVSDPVPEVVAQWHEIPDRDLGEDWRSPPISLEIRNDSFYVKVLWASAPVNTNYTKDGEIYYNLGPVDKNIWNDWVFHIKFRCDSTGILEVWKNKTMVLTHNGANSYNDRKYPYFKVGIYKWGWSGGGSRSPESKRVVYIDEVRVGNKKANIDMVSPK